MNTAINIGVESTHESAVTVQVGNHPPGYTECHFGRTADTQARRLRGSARPADRRVPRVVRQLVMAHQMARALGDGRARDQADLARQLKVSRARITQLSHLLRLAPAIQSFILTRPAGELRGLSERALRSLVAEPDPIRQWGMLEELREGRAKKRPAHSRAGEL